MRSHRPARQRGPLQATRFCVVTRPKPCGFTNPKARRLEVTEDVKSPSRAIVLTHKTIMKKSASKLGTLAAAFSALALAPISSFAQGTVVTTTAPAATATTTTTAATTTAGTISEFTPGSQIVVQTSAGSPMTYSVSKTTTYVDTEGNTVSYETIRPGTPTTVYYVTEAGRPVVSKVVVQKTATAGPVRATTTTETTETTTTTRK